MASKLNFNGVVTQRPGVYSRVVDLEPTAIRSGNLVVIAGLSGLEGKKLTLLDKVGFLNARPSDRLTTERMAERIYTPFGDLNAQAPTSVRAINAGTSTQAFIDFGGVRVRSKVWGPEGNRMSASLTQAGTTWSLAAERDRVGEIVTVETSSATMKWRTQAAADYGSEVPNCNIIVSSADVRVRLGKTVAAGDDPTINILGNGNLPHDTGLPCAGPVSITLGAGATPQPVTVIGLNSTGEAIQETLTPITSDTVSTTLGFVTILDINTADQGADTTISWDAVVTALGDIPNINVWMREVNLACKSGFDIVDTQGRIVKGVDLNLTNYNASNTVVTISDSAARIVNEANARLLTVTAERLPSGAAPTATAETPLGGGTYTAPAIADWEASLATILNSEVDVIAIQSSDESVHTAVKTHLDAAANAGRPRQAWVYVPETTPFTTAKTRAQLLNHEHMNLTMQGEDVDNKADMLSLRLAAAQTSQAVGIPLTNKKLPIVSTTQHTTLDPQDPESAITAGIVVVNQSFWFGAAAHKVERSISTYTQNPDSLFFSEISVVHAVNTVRRDLVAYLAEQVGTAISADSVNALRTLTEQRLDKHIREAILTGYKDLSVTVADDKAQVSVDLQPTLPLNFITITFNVGG